jgi:hypothetical protein
MGFGTSEEAETAAEMSVNPPEGGAEHGWEVIGAGKERIVYLAPSGIVYKVGSLTPAVTERDRFARMLQGELAAHVPPHELYSFTVVSRQGHEQSVGVMAMKHLPHDDSVDMTDVRVHKLVAVTGDFNQANVHANRGRLWLIDAAGLPDLRDWGTDGQAQRPDTETV